MNINLKIKVVKVMELFVKHKVLRNMFYSVVLIALVYAISHLLSVIRWW